MLDQLVERHGGGIIMQYVEIERKFRLDDPEAVRARMRELAAQPRRSTRQVDTYYNAPHRDFLAHRVVSEWLRLRQGDGLASINYKRWLPLGAAEQTHCDEFESAVADGEAVARILSALAFVPIVTVDKQREEWAVGESMVVALDSVLGLGHFVEVEHRGEAETVEAANDELDRLIEGLGLPLGERDRRGYPYLLLQSTQPVDA